MSANKAKPYQLHYVRTKERHEVDFALVCQDKITQLIEVKYSDDKLSPALETFLTDLEL